MVCLGAAFPTSSAVRLLEVLAAKAAAGGADPAAFAGLLLNVLSGTSAAALRQSSWPRHAALVTAACGAALQLGPPTAVAAALLPPLLACASGIQAGGGEGSSWAAYSLLQLCAALAAAAAAAQEPWLPAEPVAAALPQLMLRLQASCQPQEAAAAAAGSKAGGSGAEQLGAADSTALCLRLLSLLPQPLLPALLAAVPGSVAGGAAAGRLPAALQLLVAVLREQPLHEVLLELQPVVQAALAACKAASVAAGGDSQSSRKWQEQVRQVEAAAAAVLGTA